MPMPFVRRTALYLLFFAASPLALFAQSATTQNATTTPFAAASPLTAPTETLVVLGTATPVPLAESPRPVEVFAVRPLELSAETPLDLLRQDSSVFIEQRGAGGAQSDLVLEGGSFEQTLVLLNGFRVNDAQTGHHNLDLPVPMEAMDSIEVLEGAGSTLHGVDALAGVVDFLTVAPAGNSLRLRLGEGSFQANEESLVAAATRGHWSGRATADRNFSLGFMPDRDYRNEDASTESWRGSRLGVTDLLFAASDRSFGANQFYGDFPSWERTKGLFASIRQELGAHTSAAFGYRRHTDEFVLVRSDPAIYENNHIDGSWQANLRRTVTIANLLPSCFWALSPTATAFARTTWACTRAIAARATWTSICAPPRGAGASQPALREEIFSGGAVAVFSPQLSASLRLASQLKLRASGGYGFRIPTYTDLYYSDPVDSRQSKSEARIGVERERRRGLRRERQTHAFRHRFLFAAARDHRLRERRRAAQRLASRLLHRRQHLVRRQPQRAALCRR